jgi:hypothetical protein
LHRRIVGGREGNTKSRRHEGTKTAKTTG